MLQSQLNDGGPVLPKMGSEDRDWTRRLGVRIKQLSKGELRMKDRTHSSWSPPSWGGRSSQPFLSSLKTCSWLPGPALGGGGEGIESRSKGEGEE